MIKLDWKLNEVRIMIKFLSAVIFTTILLSLEFLAFVMFLYYFRHYLFIRILSKHYLFLLVKLDPIGKFDYESE
jgi:hypothetical protein